VAGVVEENFESSEFVLAVTVYDGRFSNMWVLDNACIFHMSPKMDWFTTYKSVNGDPILMEKNKITSKMKVIPCLC
jgi:hypothetical protein